MRRLYARSFPVISFLSLVCLPAAGQVQSGEKGQAPANVANAEDPLPRGALARLGTLRWRHTQPISFLAILPDGGTVLTVCQDQTVHLWDSKTGQQVRQFGPPRKSDNLLDSPMGNLKWAGRPGLGAHRPWQVYAALSADGKLLASCSEDGPIHLWDVAAGRDVRTIRTSFQDPLVGRIAIPGRRVLAALALAANGRTLAAAGRDGEIMLWDTGTGAELKHLSNATNQDRRTETHVLQCALAFSPDGESLIEDRLELTSVTFCKTFCIWDHKGGKIQFQIKEQPGNSSCGIPTYSPDGALFARVGAGGVIHLMNSKTFKDITQWQGPQWGARLLFSPDGKTLATQNLNDKEILLWTIEQKSPESISIKPSMKFRSRGFDPAVLETSMAFSPNGTIMAMAQNQALFLTEVKSDRDVRPSAGHSAAVATVHFSRNAESILTQGEEGVGYIWDAATGREKQRMQAPSDLTLERPRLSPDGKTWVNGHLLGGIGLWDSATTKSLVVIPMDKTGYSAFAFSPNGKVLAIQEAVSPMIHLIDASNGKEIRRLEVPTYKGTSDQMLARLSRSDNRGLIFSPDGGKLAGSTKGKSIGIWDVSQATLLRQMSFPDEFQRPPAAFSPDGRTFARVNEEGGVTLWEVATGRPRRYFGKKPKELVRADPFEEDNGIGAFLPLLGRLPIISHQSEASAALLFSPRSTLLCLGGPDNEIKLWNVATGKQEAQVHGDEGETTCLDFSPDGKRLVSGSMNTTALIWDVTALLPTSPTASRQLSNSEIDACWTDLAGDDAAKAFEAICLLSACPKAAVEFLSMHIRPIPPLDSPQVERWIKDLDDRQFQVRNQANHELEILGERAVPALQKALKDKPSAEVRSRVDELLRKAALELTGERLRVLRAIELLERAGSAECKELLRSLAKGDAGAMQTREAADSVRRLEGVGK